MFRELVVVNALLLSLFLSPASSPIAVAAEPLAPAIKWIPKRRHLGRGTNESGGPSRCGAPPLGRIGGEFEFRL